MDRRNHERFELEASAEFSWRDAGGVRWRGRGTTRDLSEAGLFVVTSDAPPSGTPVRLEVHASSKSGPGLLVQTKGKVVRVEPAGQAVVVHQTPAAAHGFAVATNTLVLRSGKAALSGSRSRQSTVVAGAVPSYTRKPN